MPKRGTSAWARKIAHAWNHWNDLWQVEAGEEKPGEHGPPYLIAECFKTNIERVRSIIGGKPVSKRNDNQPDWKLFKIVLCSPPAVPIRQLKPRTLVAIAFELEPILISLHWRTTAGRKPKPLTPLQFAIVAAVDDHLPHCSNNLAEAIRRAIRAERFREFRNPRGEARLRKTYIRCKSEYDFVMLMV